MYHLSRFKMVWEIFYLPLPDSDKPTRGPSPGHSQTLFPVLQTRDSQPAPSNCRCTSCHDYSYCVSQDIKYLVLLNLIQRLVYCYFLNDVYHIL